MVRDSMYQAEIYQDGPFEGRPKAHPYQTVLLRLREIGLSPLARLVCESDFDYIARMDRIYGGLFTDLLAKGAFSDKKS